MTENRERSFEGLDPAFLEPDYWPRFRERALERARPELSRRLQLAPITISDVVNSWSRTVVPLAMAAAAGALLFLTVDSISSEGGPRGAGIDSGVEVALDADPIPTALELGGDSEVGIAIMAGGGF